MHFLVTGSREMPKAYETDIYSTLNAYLRWHPDAVMINGCGPGVDSICLRWADSLGVPVEKFPANWDKNGKAAGPIRNGLMVRRLDEAGGVGGFAFSYGPVKKSRGTWNTIQQASAKGFQLSIKEFPIV